MPRAHGRSSLALRSLGLLVLAALAATATQAQASTPHDLTGTWSCCGSGGAGAQTWTIASMDKGSGAFSGTGAGGSIKMTITGTANGSSVTLVTDYDGSSYAATFTGTIAANSLSMSGSWESNVGQKGTWTATRPSAPPPGEESGEPAGTGKTPVTGTVKPAVGELYVSDSSAIGGPAIYRVDTRNGSTALVHQGAPFSSIRGIAFGPNGDIFAADFGDGTVDEVDPKTGAATRFSQPTTFLSRPWGIAFGSWGGEGDFFVTDISLHSVARVNVDTGEVRQAVSGNGLLEPHGIATAVTGARFVADFGAATLFRFLSNPVAFKQGPFNQMQDVAVAFGPHGYRFFVSDGGVVYTWEEPDTRLQRTQVVPKPLLSGLPLRTATGLALSLDGKTLYVASAGLAGQGEIIAYDLVKGKATVLAGGFQTPIGLAVAPPKAPPVKIEPGSSGLSASPGGVTLSINARQVVLLTASVAVVNLPGGSAAGASSAARPKPVQRVARPNERTWLRVPFKRPLAKRIRAALHSGRPVKAKVTITATAENGSVRRIVKRVPIGR